MLESIQFSINIVLPSFFIIFLGRLITLRHLMSGEQMDQIGRLTFRYLLSVKIFNEISANDLSTLNGGTMAVFCGTALVITTLIIWAFAARLMRKRESIGAFVQNCFRCSFTVLGMSMVETFSGAEGVARASLLLAVGTILLNILACMVLAKPGAAASVPAAIWSVGKSILTNPIIIAVSLGMLFGFCGLHFPPFLDKPLNDLGGIAAPLSLLCIGSSLNLERLRGSFKYALIGACIKTWGLALVVIPAAILCGFRDFELTVITIFFTAANPSANYVMALSTGNDSELAATGIVLSTLMCIFTTIIAITLLHAWHFL